MMKKVNTFTVVYFSLHSIDLFILYSSSVETVNLNFSIILLVDL